MQTDRPVSETQFEAMAERYRQELLRMQRATPPGRTAKDLVRPAPRAAEPPQEEMPAPPVPAEEPETPASPQSVPEAEAAPAEAPQEAAAEPTPAKEVAAAAEKTTRREWKLRIDPDAEREPVEAPQEAAAEPAPAKEATAAAEKTTRREWRLRIDPDAETKSAAAKPEPPVQEAKPPAVSPLLPIVQSAVEDAARQALRKPWPGETLVFPQVGRVCGAAGVFTPSKEFTALFPALAAPVGLRLRFSAMLPEGAPDVSRCQRAAALLLQERPEIPFWMTETAFSADPKALAAFAGSVLPDPESGLRSPDAFWEAVLQTPESLAAVCELFGARGTPPSWRAVSFCSPPLLWETAAGQRFARCRLIPAEHAESLTARQTQALGAADPDALARDLWLALENGETAVWSLTAQLADPAGVLCSPTRPWGEIPPPVVLGQVEATHNVSPRIARAWKCEATVPVCRASGVFVPAPDESETERLAENLAPELQRLSGDVADRVRSFLAARLPVLKRALARQSGA